MMAGSWNHAREDHVKEGAMVTSGVREEVGKVAYPVD